MNHTRQHKYNTLNTYPSSSNIAVDPHLFRNQALEHCTLIVYGLSELFQTAAVIGHWHREPHESPAGAKATLNGASESTTVNVTTAHYTYRSVQNKAIVHCN